MIEIRGLVKRYGNVAAVDEIDLTVDAGEIFGILGPNGPAILLIALGLYILLRGFLQNRGQNAA